MVFIYAYTITVYQCKFILCICISCIRSQCRLPSPIMSRCRMHMTRAIHSSYIHTRHPRRHGSPLIQDPCVPCDRVLLQLPSSALRKRLPEPPAIKHFQPDIRHADADRKLNNISSAFISSPPPDFSSSPKVLSFLPQDSIFR